MLYAALAGYALGAIVALTSLFTHDKRPQHIASILMIGGFAAHTTFIGMIWARTGHPPLTNLPETASFISWTILVVELALYFRYRVCTAAFFVYPLAFLLLLLTASMGVAWILFAILLQWRMSGVFRGRRVLFVSAGAFAAIVVSILGIAHG